MQTSLAARAQAWARGRHAGAARHFHACHAPWTGVPALLRPPVPAADARSLPGASIALSCTTKCLTCNCAAHSFTQDRCGRGVLHMFATGPSFRCWELHDVYRHAKRAEARRWCGSTMLMHLLSFLAWAASAGGAAGALFTAAVHSLCFPASMQGMAKRGARAGAAASALL